MQTWVLMVMTEMEAPAGRDEVGTTGIVVLTTGGTMVELFRAGAGTMVAEAGAGAGVLELRTGQLETDDAQVVVVNVSMEVTVVVLAETMPTRAARKMTENCILIGGLVCR